MVSAKNGNDHSRHHAHEQAENWAKNKRMIRKTRDGLQAQSVAWEPRSAKRTGPRANGLLARQLRFIRGE